MAPTVNDATPSPKASFPKKRSLSVNVPEYRVPSVEVFETWKRGDTEFILRAVTPDDKGMLLEGFSKLSDDSKEMRFFFVKKELSPDELKFYTEVDMKKHYAVGVTIRDPKNPTKETGVGVGRYITMSSKPDTAELAFVILDEYQNKGIGQHMLRQLIRGAQENGLKHLQCEVLPTNLGMRRLITHYIPNVRARQCGDDLVLLFPVPESVPIPKSPRDGDPSDGNSGPAEEGAQLLMAGQGQGGGQGAMKMPRALTGP
eukprot:comp44888_c0_seq1/m.47525 comp44888_c0_seq1/g.47525  ORF comp44888_c0_seq1/g.47525 comp44888_c0_seq1/m.47525 type:complete len:258 (-) comp44888_c0_seq1:77-850(-)